MKGGCFKSSIPKLCLGTLYEFQMRHHDDGESWACGIFLDTQSVEKQHEGQEEEEVTDEERDCFERDIKSTWNSKCS